MKYIKYALLMCFLLSCVMPAHTKAAIASGSSGDCSWEISNDGILTISPTNETSGILDNSTNSDGSDVPWYSNSSSITKVVIENGVSTNTSAAALFKDLTNCTEMDLSGLDTSNTENLSDLFNGRANLNTVKLGSNFKFKGNGITAETDQAILPTPLSSSPYTGKWVKADGSLASKTSEEIRDQYDDNASWAGRWIWENTNPRYYQTSKPFNVKIFVDGTLVQTNQFAVESSFETTERATFWLQARNLTLSQTNLGSSGTAPVKATSAAVNDNTTIRRYYNNGSAFSSSDYAYFQLDLGLTINPGYKFSNQEVTSSNTDSFYLFNGDNLDNLSTTARSMTGNINISTTQTGLVDYQANGVRTDNASISLYFMRKTYTLTFNPMDGTVDPTSKNVMFEDPYGELPVPTKTDYVFLGWFTDANNGTEVTETTVMPAKNVTVYAHWRDMHHTLNFNATGGTVSPVSKTVKEGEAYGELPTPTKEHFRFDGWYILENGGVAVNASTVMNETTDTTVYAHWTAEHRLIYNATGGTVSPTEKWIPEGDTYGELPTPTREHFLFDGWYTAETGGNTVSAATVFDSTEDITIYAHWIPEHRLIYDANGGTVDPTEKWILEGKKFGKLPTPTWEHHHFDGWYTEREGGAVVTKDRKMRTSDFTIYAHWTPEHKLSFDPNGGSVNPTEKWVAEGSQYEELPDPTKDGSVFIGWYTEPEGGKKISSITVMGTEDTTVYAHWRVDTHSLTFDSNGGSDVSSSNRNVKEGNAYGTLPTPTKNGWIFDGWFTKKAGGEAATASTVMGPEDVTLYAHWGLNRLCVIFEAMNGTEPEIRNLSSGAQVGTLPVPTKDGYVFLGWTREPYGGSSISPTTTFTGTRSVTVYAQWQKIGADTYVTNITNPVKATPGRVLVTKSVEKRFYDKLVEDGTVNERGDFSFTLYGPNGYEETKTVTLLRVEQSGDNVIMQVAFEDLDLGEYRLYENETPWFVLEDIIDLQNAEIKTDDEERTYVGFTLTEDNCQQEVKATFKNVCSGKIKIIKYNHNKTATLEGVEFKLAKSDNSNVFYGTTDENGEILFDNLELGDYYLTETKTIDGYNLLNNTLEITIPLKMTQEEVDAAHVDTSEASYSSSERKWFFYSLTYEITNTSTLDLPLTGALQNKMIYVILLCGFVMIGIAIGLRTKKGDLNEKNA